LNILNIPTWRIQGYRPVIQTAFILFNSGHNINPAFYDGRIYLQQIGGGHLSARVEVSIHIDADRCNNAHLDKIDKAAVDNKKANGQTNEKTDNKQLVPVPVRFPDYS